MNTWRIRFRRPTVNALRAREEGTREVRLTLSAIKSAVDGNPLAVEQLGEHFRAHG